MIPASRATHVPPPRAPAPDERAALPGSALTTVLLASVLFSGPLVLGGMRYWFELPLMLVVALLLFVQGLRLLGRAGKLRRVPLDLIDLSVLVFTLYAMARWLTSPTEYYSRLEIIYVIATAVVFLTCRHGLARRRQGLFLLGMLVALGVFETAFGYYLNTHPELLPFGPTETLHRFSGPRWVGTYPIANHYGALLVMALGAALAWGSFSKISWPLRIVCFYLAAVMLVGVMFSGSRGSMLGAIAAIGALSLFGVRYGMVRWWVPLAGGAVLLATFVVALAQSPLVQSRLVEVRDTFGRGTLSHYVRIELAHDALRIAADHPVFGTGPATFVFLHPRYQSATFGRKAVLVHNDYLNCLTDYGAIGLTIALVFLLAVTIRFFRRPRATSRWQDRVLLTAGFMAWAALLVHSFLDFNLHVPGNAFIFFALIGLALRRFAGESEDPRQRLNLPTRPIAWALILFSILYAAETGRTALAVVIDQHAEAQSLDARPADSIAAAQAALRIDPGNVPALVFLGDLHRMLSVHQPTVEGRMREGRLALSAYQQAARENPLDDTILASVALTFDIMHRFPEAYFCYVQVLHNQPYDGQFWYRLGNHFWESGLLPKAEQAYLKGLACPHGAEENVAAAQEIRGYLAARGVPLPAPGTDPLQSTGDEPEESTVP